MMQRLLKLYTLILISTFFLSFVTCEKPFTKFKSCKGANKVRTVQIKGCGKGSSSACKVKSNEKVTVIFKMKAGIDAKNISAVVSGVIGDIRLPMPKTKEKDICGEIKKGSCPLEKNAEFTHELKLNIPVVAKMKVIAEVKYVNEDKKTIACAQIPTQVI